MPDLNFADQYQNVLMSMESIMVGHYRDEPKVTDYEVGLALDALIKDYRGEGIGHAPKPPQNAGAEALYVVVQWVCDIFLGRAQAASKKMRGKTIAKDQILTVDEIIACLKYLRKSVDFWTKSHGRQGYLDYVKNFV